MPKAKRLGDSLSVEGLPYNVQFKYGYRDYFNRQRRSVEFPPTPCAIKELKQYWTNPSADQDTINWLKARIDPININIGIDRFTSFSGLEPYKFQYDSIIYAIYYKEKLNLSGVRILLADDPRMGKSIQALSIIRHLPNQHHVLVLCLKSLINQWVDYVVEWLPDYEPVVVRGSKAKREEILQARVTGKTAYITNWETARMRIPELSRNWWCIIGDEAHKIKNRQAQLSKSVAYLSHKAQHLILLTATPTESTPDEYWHLLHCLNKQDFSNYWRFVGWYVETRNNGFGLELVGAKNKECLQQHLAPYVIRRKAAEVVDLPEEVYQTISVELPNKFRKHYEQAQEELLIELAEQDLTIAGAAALFIRLRQLAIHPYVIDTTYDIENPLGKYETLLELLSTLPGQVIIYSSFINAVRLADQYLESSAIYAGSKGTDQTIEDFKVGKVQYLCATVQKAGAGLNLGNADYAVYLDRPVSSIQWRQSKDRIKLIGKQKPIGVYTLEAQDTIDNYVNRLVNHKMSTIEDTQIIKKLLDFYKE